MTAVYIKLFVGIVLFGTWVFLSIFPQPNTAAIISFIQLTLGGLAHNLATTDTNPPTTQTVQVVSSQSVPQPVVKPVEEIPKPEIQP